MNRESIDDIWLSIAQCLVMRISTAAATSTRLCHTAIHERANRTVYHCTSTYEKKCRPNEMCVKCNQPWAVVVAIVMWSFIRFSLFGHCYASLEMILVHFIWVEVYHHVYGDHTLYVVECILICVCVCSCMCNGHAQCRIQVFAIFLCCSYWTSSLLLARIGQFRGRARERNQRWFSAYLRSPI